MQRVLSFAMSAVIAWKQFAPLVVKSIKLEVSSVTAVAIN
jgi:hypothetical protein